MTTHTGSCHCGAVAWEARIDLSEPVIECNCSHCSKKGFLLAFTGPENFTLKTPEAPLTEYRFHKHQIAHLFCPACGVQSFARGTTPKTGQEMIAVNVRCIDGIDLAALTRLPVDGKSF